MAVSYIPDGYHSVTPYLIVDDGPRALEFYKRAFGAVELFRLDMPDGRLGHAEFTVGDSHIMLAEEFPEMEALAPKSIGGTAVSLMVYTEDADAMFARALEAGAVALRPVADQFYGDRAGMLRDPFGHKWSIATHIEDVSAAELERRTQAMFRQGGP